MEQKFIEMAKVIFTSIDHYRESGRDDKFNIDSIAEYLQRQFLLQQTPCTAHVCPKCGDMGRCEPRTLESPDGQECDCGKLRSTPVLAQ